MNTRFKWLDWMKVISMFFIVWGHLFPETMTNFLYTFNVPVFFVISGILGGDKFIFHKWVNGLVVPYCVVCFSYLFVNSGFLYLEGNLSLLNILRSIAYMLAGFQSCPNGIGAVAMWFVYTLLIIKVIFGLVKDWRILGVFSILCLIGTYLCHNHSLYWSVQNILISFPFYYVGWLYANYNRPLFLRLTASIKECIFDHTIIAVLFVILGFVILYVIGEVNGFARMYACDYGNHFGLFVIGGLLGSFIIYVISIRLENYYPSWVKTISIGCIVILAYQFIPIKVYGGLMLFKMIHPFKNNDILTLIVALLIMWMSVVAIKYVQRYCPLILGGRRVE